MFNFDDNALITISPQVAPPACGATRFRWTMHAALPFVIPSTQCLSAEFERSGRKYKVGFHNHFDREISLKTDVACALPVVRLVQKLKDGQKAPLARDGWSVSREYLQSVAVFSDTTEYDSVIAAFGPADAKIKDCFEFLGDYLGKLQRSLPYLMTWTLYPVSVFDVGVVHHTVEHFCPTTSQWIFVAGGVAMSLARQLRAPLFVAELKHIEEPTDLDLANELLAEAQLAIFRRLPRLAVLNSFTATETLANAVYKRRRLEQLRTWGVPEPEAEKIAESERKKNRTDEKFLLGSGMNQCCGRSLAIDNKALYDEITHLEENVRHQVSHRGARPSLDEAKASFRACCECVRWLSDVAGYQPKAMVPPADASAPGFRAGSHEPYVCSAAEMEVLRQMFRIVLPRLDAAPVASPNNEASQAKGNAGDATT